MRTYWATGIRDAGSGEFFRRCSSSLACKLIWPSNRMQNLALENVLCQIAPTIALGSPYHFLCLDMVSCWSGSQNLAHSQKRVCTKRGDCCGPARVSLSKKETVRQDRDQKHAEKD